MIAKTPLLVQPSNRGVVHQLKLIARLRSGVRGRLRRKTGVGRFGGESEKVNGQSEGGNG